MIKPYLIVGNGLAGCVMAMTMKRHEIPFRICGVSMAGEASMASSGLITPVTGRKYVKSWMIDELISEAVDFYSWTEELFGSKYFFPVEIIRFLSHLEAKEAWKKRQSDSEYAVYVSQKRYESLDLLERAYGVITGAWRLDTPMWIMDVRSYLQEEGVYEERDMPFNAEADGYKGIIFATGAISPLISAGLVPNKGEALIVKLTGWKFPSIIKDEAYFVPLGEDIFWVGSYYDRWPDDPGPSSEGKRTLLEAIQKVHAGSYVILGHLSGVRPTTIDRRPVIGPVHGHPGKFLFNGMGTKGTSLAPYWAKQLVDYFTSNHPLDRQVLPSRFTINT